MRGQFVSKNQDPQTEPVQTLQQLERKYILKVYKKFGKNKAQTARALGIALNTLKSKLERYDVENLSTEAPIAKK
jgi:DNA-binding NtrC family response regulator